MVKMAKSDQQMWSEYKDFDKNPYLLKFTNGTVDLRTSTLRAHDPQDVLSCLVPHTHLRTSATVGEVGIPLHAVRRERSDR